MSAGMINRFMEMLRLNEGDAEDEYEEDEETVETLQQSYERPTRAGYFARKEQLKNDERVSRSAKVLPMTGASPAVTSSKMVITEPQCFDDVKEIADHLKERRSVIVNLETLTKEDQRRIVDFLSGSTYVIDGNIQKISSLIYLITPKTVEIQNDVEKAQYRSKLSFSWMK